MGLIRRWLERRRAKKILRRRILADEFTIGLPAHRAIEAGEVITIHFECPIDRSELYPTVRVRGIPFYDVEGYSNEPLYRSAQGIRCLRPDGCNTPVSCMSISDCGHDAQFRGRA